MKPITRRMLLVAAGAAATLSASVPSPQPGSTSGEDDLASARDSMARNRSQMAQIELPMATEPAFVFRP